MKGKINYQERLLSLIQYQEYATFGYVPINYLKAKDCISWLN